MSSEEKSPSSNSPLIHQLGKLSNKVAIVTGGSSGIGEAIALRYAKEGAEIAVVYSKNESGARGVVENITSDGGTAKAYRSDCSKVDLIYKLVAEVISDFNRVDIVVNNAGIFHTVPVSETTEEIWDDTMDLNLKGLFFMTKALLPEFRKNGGGKVVNITSVAGTGAFINCPAYCASKGGAVNLTRALAAELGKENINVNSIAPGNVATRLNAHVRGPGNDDYIELMKTMTPTGSAFMDPEDIAGTAVFLASDDSKRIHGETVIVDAGWSVW
jgi:NAD(P)-dependent dehydrogenase (short-subunit alcohol dehydrogenase family)